MIIDDSYTLKNVSFKDIRVGDIIADGPDYAHVVDVWIENDEYYYEAMREGETTGFIAWGSIETRENVFRFSLNETLKKL